MTIKQAFILVPMAAAIAWCIVWAFAWTYHHPRFCEDESAALAYSSLECGGGARLTIEQARDKSWSVCRCPR